MLEKITKIFTFNIKILADKRGLTFAAVADLLRCSWFRDDDCRTKTPEDLALKQRHSELLCDLEVKVRSGSSVVMVHESRPVLPNSCITCIFMRELLLDCFDLKLAPPTS